MGLSRTKPSARRKRKRKGLPALPVVLVPRPRHAVRRPSWKLVGLAGIAGVAATGAVVARNRRAQQELGPDELRARLHERLAAVDDPSSPPP